MIFLLLSLVISIHTYFIQGGTKPFQPALVYACPLKGSSPQEGGMDNPSLSLPERLCGNKTPVKENRPCSFFFQSARRNLSYATLRKKVVK